MSNQASRSIDTSIILYEGWFIAKYGLSGEVMCVNLAITILPHLSS